MPISTDVKLKLLAVSVLGLGMAIAAPEHAAACQYCVSGQCNGGLDFGNGGAVYCQPMGDYCIYTGFC